MPKKITGGMFMQTTAKIMTYNISILTTSLALGKDDYILLIVFLLGYLHLYSIGYPYESYL